MKSALAGGSLAGRISPQPLSAVFTVLVTTRGFAGILHAGLDGLSAEEILNTPGEFSSQLGLQDLVSPLRLRGMAMLARIKRQVREQTGLTIPAGEQTTA